MAPFKFPFFTKKKETKKDTKKGNESSFSMIVNMQPESFKLLIVLVVVIGIFLLLFTGIIDLDDLKELVGVFYNDQ